MGPDNEYIHCTQLNETHWKMIAGTAGRVSIATAIEMQMSSRPSKSTVSSPSSMSMRDTTPRSPL
jgi:hypothetical protein